MATPAKKVKPVITMLSPTLGATMPMSATGTKITNITTSAVMVATDDATKKDLLSSRPFTRFEYITAILDPRS
jgi:hypothetical protein